MRMSDWSSDVCSSDLLCAVFLGVGAQAATVREIQMLSLPITIFQVGMFSLCAAAASAPGSGLARFAQLFPFSSPLAMAARAATDDAKAVHLLALGWQALGRSEEGRGGKECGRRC